jgi:hypothetical protein
MNPQVVDELVLAYIDPGSGSIIFQAVVGGVMVVGMTARVYWRKLRGLFQRNG